MRLDAIKRITQRVHFVKQVSRCVGVQQAKTPGRKRNREVLPYFN
jgi:hypothetical protein